MVVVIPIRFKEKDLKKIDELVKSGVFKSRSEAVRSLSLEAAQNRCVDLAEPDLGQAIEVILNSLREDRSSLTITLGKSVAEFIAEGRQRL